MQKKHVLLCGTQYGQSYLPAIFQSAEFELAGILAKGSDRSVRFAEQYGVELFHDVEAVNIPVDIACIAINDKVAAPMAEKFFQKGVDVLVEHPVSVERIQQIQSAAQTHGRRCHINSHFSDLPPATEFSRLGQRLNQQAPPMNMVMQCNSRTLFSMLDLVMRCFGTITVEQLTITKQGNYRCVTLLVNDIPTTLVYQHWRYETDDSEDSPLGHQLTVTYPQGTLCLGGTFGPCSWSPLITSKAPRALPVYQVLEAMKPAESISVAIEWRKKANQQALSELLATQELLKQHQPEYQYRLCELWSELMEKLGSQVCEKHTRPFRPPTEWNLFTSE